ncbi:MAG: UDP-2,3-diacylglucosamine diphosphatase [Aquabacterium sp.]
MTGKPPFPAQAGSLNAPPSWRCIDFISDIHLDPSLPATTHRWMQYLATTTADAVLILGDLFEAWIGDDHRSAPYEQSCVQALRQAGERLHLGIMVGNRDFLVGQALLDDCRAQALADPTVLSAFGQRALLMHGDELCLADTAYLPFRAMVRQTAWQQDFLSKPLAVRQAVAEQMRQASQAHQKQQGPMSWADVDEEAAGAWMQAAQSPILIHGHTHHPQSQPFGPTGGIRHVLSDWDLDHGHPRAEVLRWQADGFHRIAMVP